MFCLVNRRLTPLKSQITLVMYIGVASSSCWKKNCCLFHHFKVRGESEDWQ